jgi:hypothetical protein
MRLLDARLLANAVPAAAAKVKSVNATRTTFVRRDATIVLITFSFILRSVFWISVYDHSFVTNFTNPLGMPFMNA